MVIFDLDGVLVDAKEIHYNALNEALRSVDEKYCITLTEHLNTYDGLKTRYKLEFISNKKGLPREFHNQIWDLKQEATRGMLNSLMEDNSLIAIMEFLKGHDIRIACCSNSIKDTVMLVLKKLGIIKYFDYIFSNEDVLNSKPHPEIYWKAIMQSSLFPGDVLIIEDSPPGITAALNSGCSLMRVKNRKDLTVEKLQKYIKIKNSNYMNPKWQDPNLNVLIPMAGAGSRFAEAGYTFPKPLIEINGEPMIKVVVDNLNFDSSHIFIVQKSHREKYNLDSLLPIISRDCSIIEVDGITEGAACTTLLAKELINNDNPLIIANSDQYIRWDTCEFMYRMQELDVDAGILCFNSTHPKWSFARLDNNDLVVEVAEKKPISNIATVGVYYWKRGSDYVKYAEEMINNNIRHNNEFYVCPVFNQAIKAGKKIKISMVESMWGIGTPEDLNAFLSKFYT